MSNLSDVIEKVKKLLALSKSSNANEAATAASVANRLIDEFRLSEADVAGNHSESDPMVRDDQYVYETGRVIPWKSRLVVTLASHYGCAVFNDTHYNNTKRRKVSRYKLLGRKSDIQIVQYMFAWLSSECSRISDLEAKGMGKVFVFSYCNGFVAGIGEQLHLSRKAAEKEATSNAIVKINARLDEANDFMKQTYPNLRMEKSYGHSRLNTDAYSAGQSKGRSLHLGSALGGGKVKLLGGK